MFSFILQYINFCYFYLFFSFFILQDLNYTTPVTKNKKEIEISINSEFTPKTTRDGVRVIRGRLVIVHNPRGRFDILGPDYGVFGGQNVGNLDSDEKAFSVDLIELDEIGKISENKDDSESINVNINVHKNKNENDNLNGKLELKEYYQSDKNREMEHIQTLHYYHNNDNNYNNNNNNNNNNRISPKNKNIERSERQKVQLNNVVKTTSSSTSFCEVLTDGSPYDAASSTFFGTVISRGKILQSSEIRNVHFGIRNNSYFVGYLKLSTSLLSQGSMLYCTVL